jgi:hypothetical protein
LLEIATVDPADGAGERFRLWGIDAPEGDHVCQRLTGSHANMPFRRRPRAERLKLRAMPTDERERQALLEGLDALVAPSAARAA